MSVGAAFLADIEPHTRSFEASAGVVAMAVSNATVWLALDNAGIEVRNVHTGAVEHIFRPAYRPTERATRVWSMIAVPAASNEHEQQMWLGLSSGTIEVYDGADYSLLRQMHKHMSGVYCLAQNRGRVVYSGGNDFQIAQWRTEDGALLRMFRGHANYVRCLWAEPELLISGSDDATIRLWDAHTGAVQQVVRDHHSVGVSALCRVGQSMWSGDASGYVVAMQLPQALRMYSISDTAQRQDDLPRHNTQEGSCNNNHSSSDSDASVCSVQRTRAHDARVTVLRRVGSRVYSASADGYVGVFSAHDGTLLRRLPDHAGAGVTSLLCVMEVNRYYLWTTAGSYLCGWHQDEHTSMTAEREGWNDMLWYYASSEKELLQRRTQQEALLDEHQEMLELAMLSGQNGALSEAVIRDYLASQSARSRSEAAEYWLLSQQMKEAEQYAVEAMRKRTELQATLARKRDNLQLLQTALQKVKDALQAAESSESAALGSTVIAPAAAAAVPHVVPGGFMPPSQLSASQPNTAPLAPAAHAQQSFTPSTQ